MALCAGVMSLTLEFAKDLKDRDWFCRMDPYCIVRVGGQTFRSKTTHSGGRNPVWNETFKFNIINENDVDIEIKDDDVGRDEHIGSATFTMARARELGSDRVNVAVMCKKSQKQHGFISVLLAWSPNTALNGGSVTAPVAAPAPVCAPPPSVYGPPQPQPPSYAVAPPPPQPVYASAPPAPQPSYVAPSAYAPAPPPQTVYVAPPPPPQTVYVAPPPPPLPVYVAAPTYVAPPPPPTVVYYETPYHHHHHHGHHHHHHRDVEVVVFDCGW